MYCWRKISTTIGTSLEVENCQLSGQVSQDSPYSTKNHRMDIHGPGGDNYVWKHMSDATKRKEKQKWAIEKPKLDSARKLRGIYFIDLDYGEFKDIMKNARRKLEVPMPAAMPCKTQREQYRETCSVEKKCKTKYACIVEADESTRKRMEGSLHEDHEDHIAGKGMN